MSKKENNKTKNNSKLKNNNKQKSNNTKINKKVANKKSSNFNIYLMIVSILTLWESITTILILNKYSILPSKYMMPISITLILLPLLLSFIMLKHKIKKKIKATASGISIIIILLLTIVLFYLNKTFKFLNNLTNNDYTTENYSVIVLKESEYNKIDDIKNKQIEYYKNEESNIEEAIKKIDQLVTTEKKEVSDYNELVDNLYSKKTDAILIEETYQGIIEETIEDFQDKTKIIYKIEVQKKAKDIAKNVDVRKSTFNIYISGIDTYGKISSVSRSDVNIIATINPETHQILLTTIPRDYYVQLDGTTGLKDKLTHAGIYGIEKSVKTIENLLDIEINYYIKVNFSSVEKIVDALGGVDVYSEYTFTGTGGSSFKKGYNRVNGKKALEFARTRKTISGGDRTRGKNQQALIEAMLTKACSKEIITKYTTILNSLEGSFQTNMSMDEMTNLIKKQIDQMPSWNVTSISLDGANGSEYTYSYGGQKLYVMIPYESTIENAKTKISEVESGKVLESSYQENTGNINITTKEETKQEEQPVEKKEEVKQEEIKKNEQTSENTANPETTEKIEEQKKEEPTNEQPKQETNQKQEEQKAEEKEQTIEKEEQTKNKEEVKQEENKKNEQTPENTANTETTEKIEEKTENKQAEEKTDTQQEKQTE